MVKVKDEAAMAEPKSASPSPSAAIFGRKPRHENHSHHHHPPFHHYPYHFHYTLSSGDSVDSGSTNGATSPAKFCFGPGFEPQTQIPGTFGAGPSQAQNNEHVVFFHVNPGVIISLQYGESYEVLRGKCF